MPIFHEPDDGRPPRPALQASSPQDLERAWKQGNGYERALLDRGCSGPAVPSISSPDGEAAFSTHARKSPLLDRVELIERLKRAKSPPCQRDNHRDNSPEPRPKTPLLSPSHYKPSRPCTPDPLRDHASAGMEIARPRSALHSGDFREEKDRDQHDERASSVVPLATSPVVPWHHCFPTAARPQSRAESPYAFPEASNYEQRPFARTRAISQSSFSSFAFLPPTSPLVQQSNNTDLDFSSRPGSRQSSRSPERSNRRHTFSPRSFRAFKSSDMAASVSGTPAARHMRKATAMPYQAHQPRRSFTSLNQFQPHSSPQTPLLGSRRPSFSDASPLHHAPMVGSYEESILRGRMSTTPSRPLNFIAKIGVLGRSQCRSNLKCPPHVAVPFPAVFYSYSTGNGRLSDDSPSPYVGLVDLENSLACSEECTETSTRKRRHTVPDPGYDDLEHRLEHDEQDRQYKSREDLRRKEKKKRRSTSPKAPPGGSYRIPQQGQLQIVIKNPNKTAVKLFLVPYDLSDMEAGQKTFIRQRSYSAGPIIDMPLSTRNNLGTDRPEAALSHSDDPNDRPILRYLIHLHICCPSKGRYYLYKSIRVVFANRVPDGKEKLRNEIQLPEPRYSTYKASRDSLASQVPSSAAAQLSADKALRRRSAGISLSQQLHSQADGRNSKHRPQLPPPAVEFTGGPSHHTDFSSPMSDMRPIPFPLTRIPSIPSRPLSRDLMDVDLASPFRSHSGYTSPSTPEIQSSQIPVNKTTSFEKLNKGDVGYGGNAFCGVGGLPTSHGAGLLARRLRGLDVEPDDDPTS